MISFDRRWGAIVNAAMFQGAWFACVIGGSVWACIVTPLILLVHWHWLARPGEWRWWLGFALIGVIVDGTLVASGGLEIESGAPIWLWALWPLFATTLHHSLGWLWSHRTLAVVGGLIGGPTSYLSGAALAGIGIQPWAVGIEAGVWGVICGVVAWRLGTPGEAKPGERRQE